MLETRHLSFRYPGNSPWLFRDLSISISPGEVVGLQGPSGRGKSTLARILAGYLPPTEGEVVMDGRPPEKNGFNPVQLIFQHPELAVDPRWKILKVLREGHAPDHELMTAFDIAPAWLERYPCELSGGQLARVCLVRALSPGMKYLVADEITTMLDALNQARIWKSLLDHIEANRVGVLAISHDGHLLKRICHRTVTLS
jgi:ABC-type dipeptide/oligopeptide/nickel transport system ATPase subunit